MAAGVPDDLYWRSTPAEVGALLDEIVERESRQERAASLRAGLVTSAIYNVNRKRGTAAYKPSDFVAKAGKDRVLSPSDLAKAFDAFTEDHNRKVKKVKK